MRYLEDPRQSVLFDVFADILSSVAYRRLTGGWQHLFRCAVLKLMPVVRCDGAVRLDMRMTGLR